MRWTLLSILLASLVWCPPVQARPPVSWAFECPADTFSTMDAYVFTDFNVLHLFQICENGTTTPAGPPPIPDIDGNVWFIWLYIDTNTISTARNGYCELHFSDARAEGACTADPASGAAGRSRYFLLIPNVTPPPG
jgi:hypothetical protein